MFYGDGMITPAISVLGAVEGLEVARRVAPYRRAGRGHPCSSRCSSLQRGTAAVGRAVRPASWCSWFVVLAVLGGIRSSSRRGARRARSVVRVRFVAERPALAFLAFGAVVLVRYRRRGALCRHGSLRARADPPRVDGLVVCRRSCSTTSGRARSCCAIPAAIENPFYLLAPEWALLPLVVLATCAAIIASQAVISGAFSLTRQPSQLDFLPRLRVLHTSDAAQGQIYVPFVNWLLLCGVLSLVLGFGSSSALAGAYGIAVNGDMIISTVLLMIVVGERSWALAAMRCSPCSRCSLAIEACFLSSNLTKIADGGWFPLVLGVALFTVLSTWRRGVALLQRAQECSLKPSSLMSAQALRPPRACRGRGVFFSSRHNGYPSALLHNLKHNKVVHERLVFVCIEFLDAPYVEDSERLDVERIDTGMWRLFARFGFREDPNIDKILELASLRGLKIDPENDVVLHEQGRCRLGEQAAGLGLRRKLFVWMLQNSPNVADYLGLPPHRVVELRTQVGV